MSLEVVEKAAVDFATREGKQVHSAIDLIRIFGATEGLYDSALVLGWQWVENVPLVDTNLKRLQQLHLITPQEVLGRDFVFGVAVYPENSHNDPYSNDETDRMRIRGLYKFRASHLDPDERKAIWERADDIWKEKLPRRSRRTSKLRRSKN